MRRTLAVLLLVLLAAFVAACDDDSRSDSAGGGETPVQGGGEGGAPAIQSEEGLTTVEIVDLLAPSIVRVQTESATIDQFGRVQPGTGIGTGFIIDDEGHVVTNNHVVTGANGGEPADTITVTLGDQTTVPATLVGRDAATDLAVLQIESDDLTPASWGSTADLQVGQDVVAIGYALGLEGAPSVTRGVVSAKNRTIEEPPYTIPDAIQTDAGINPGNSGGPLVNARGEVVGINTAIIRGAQNIGFAISADLARPIVEQLIAEGSIERAYVGIASVDVNAAIARNFDLPVNDGIVVTLVADGSPADAAGLQTNDVIVAVDGEPIDNTGELLSLLADREPGDTVTIAYHRGDSEEETELTLGERPAQ